MSDMPGYSARLNLEGPLEIKDWRPLVNWFLVIPQFLVAGVLLHGCRRPANERSSRRPEMKLPRDRPSPSPART
jgi:hypothetical protein